MIRKAFAVCALALAAGLFFALPASAGPPADGLLSTVSTARTDPMLLPTVMAEVASRDCEVTFEAVTSPSESRCVVAYEAFSARALTHSSFVSGHFDPGRPNRLNL